MTNEGVSGNFDIWNICPVASIYATRFAYFYLLQLKMPISTQPIRISKKRDTLLLIVALWMRLCSHFAHDTASDTRSRLTGSWHFLKRKSLKLYFYRNLQLLSFLLINIVCLDFCETSARTNFSRRIPAKVGSNFKYFLDIFSTHFLFTTPLLCLKVFLLILWQTCLIKEGMYVLKTNSEKRFLWHTLHVWLKNVKTDQGYQFPYHGVQGTHKIQLLTYSCNVQRAVEVKLPLKSKRESEKKRNESLAIDI